MALTVDSFSQNCVSKSELAHIVQNFDITGSTPNPKPNTYDENHSNIHVRQGDAGNHGCIQVLPLCLHAKEQSNVRMEHSALQDILRQRLLNVQPVSKCGIETQHPRTQHMNFSTDPIPLSTINSTLRKPAISCKIRNNRLLTPFSPSRRRTKATRVITISIPTHHSTN